MIKNILFVLGIGIFFNGIAFSEHLLENDRISGTPLLELNEESLSKLPLRTSSLKKPSLHKSQHVPLLGEAAQFYVFNFENDKYVQESATLRFTDGFINIWVSDTEWANEHVTTQVVQQVYEGLMLKTPNSSIDRDKGIVELIHANFGLPPNFDGDGITDFLLTDIQDGWQEGEGFIAGYFNPLDQYINGTFVGRTQISGSNERDILYIDTYPGIYHNDNYGYSEVLGTVSHEYQHLIHYRYDINEDEFVNEGLSELSSFLCGYGLRNPSKYLLNTNISLTGWNSELPETLAHYAKTALWTYYLYEKLGPGFIRELTHSGLSGIPGIEAALLASGMEETFNELMRKFFITITLNTQVDGADYQFDWAVLKSVHAVPQITFQDYPLSTGLKNPANALGLYRFENGDSLSISIGNPPAHLSLLINKYGKDDQTAYLDPLVPPVYSDNDFGRIWISEDLMVINYQNNAVWSLSASASQKSYITGYALADQTADLQIQVSQEIMANSFVVPYDSCRLRSVRFYNLQSPGGVNVHIFKDKIINGNYPSSDILLFNNILQGEWVELDLSTVETWRQAGETFDVGIEFVNGGIIGYCGANIENVKSFLYRSVEGHFLELSNFKVDGSTLTGQWLVDISYAAPLSNKPGGNDNIPASFTIESIGPLPYPSPSNPVLRIQYTLNKPGNLKAEIYNILGQKVVSLYNGYEQNLAGTFTWLGENEWGIPVATGTYLLHFVFEDQRETRKILVIR